MSEINPLENKQIRNSFNLGYMSQCFHISPAVGLLPRPLFPTPPACLYSTSGSVKIVPSAEGSIDHPLNVKNERWPQARAKCALTLASVVRVRVCVFR